nr:hypothetical protein [uncultured Allomuricauda sp.]
METIKMEKELLYVNKDGIAKTMQQYQAWADEAANALNLAQELLPEPLSVEQKEILLQQGKTALERLICSEYGYPKATVQFVLQSQSLDASAAFAALDQVPQRNSAVGFTISDNGVEVSSKTIERVEARHSYYVKNQKQSKALEMARGLCKTLNVGFENGVINMDDRTRLVNAFSKYIELTSARREDQVFTPAVKKIALMRG